MFFKLPEVLMRLAVSATLWVKRRLGFEEV